MRLGILVPSIGNFGKKGFYNAQETGLAKSIEKYFEEVLVYRMMPLDTEYVKEKIEGCSHSTMHFVPTRQFGSNGMVDTKLLDTGLDALILFSDIQIAVPGIWRWAKKHKIAVYPYIGVVESHSSHFLIQQMMRLLFARNLRVYKKCTCLVKTPEVGEKLREKGVKDTILAPVGLDLDLMKKDYQEYDRTELKEKYGFRKNHKVLLFIGRMTEEKQPLEMIEMFSDIVKRDADYRLLMIGNGNLDDAVDKLIREKELTGFVKRISKVTNCDIWEVYYLSHAFVNLNRQEIFGMAILEAMYYGCKVVAWHAPGPDLILENGSSGYLVQNIEEAVETIMNSKQTGEEAKKRVEECFTWKSVAEKIASVISDGNGVRA